ncbi:dicarboxylate transporter/tellurite-resistance protein TehA [Paraburkholderia bannensis]|uniref:dicarboxylate transporter/tellurite-resistance protein TehA n=1 Tax=Paraburkholderia bannensis TaxID=765414 RepID=UPI002AB7094F|nr:dicarboxylate transporter/tellurite-resistance protein TehA [Paraburkholderia bannensis]
MNTWIAKHEPMPAGFFGIAVGTLALAGAWRVAAKLWEVPASIGTALTIVALVVWAAVMAMYGLKWVAHREAAQKEWQHEVQSSFVALGPVSTMLAAQAVKLWSHDAGLALFVAGAIGQVAVGVMLHGRLWQGGRNAELVTPAIYLPTVAAGFVAATTAAAFNLPELAVMFFGSGALSWLAIESKLLNRASLAAPTVAALRPTFGIQLAPPVVGGVAWMAIMNSMHLPLTGAAGIVAYALLGYGLYQALLLLRLLPWIRAQAFAPSYWAFSFGVAALPTLAMLIAQHGGPLWVHELAFVLFAASTGVIGLLFVKTVALLVEGKLLPARVLQ